MNDSAEYFLLLFLPVMFIIRLAFGHFSVNFKRNKVDVLIHQTNDNVYEVTAFQTNLTIPPSASYLLSFFVNFADLSVKRTGEASLFPYMMTYQHIISSLKKFTGQ